MKAPIALEFIFQDHTNEPLTRGGV